ncbi:uncharacterized protein DSM5745_03811 [Aspergillus mulundensis]|uniref:Uncharacterized protein n=1 Tax=Aspergillus mulundensis TaxID=1810919 RepID=A0A3D8SLF4_9EURO|nr:hypothetical protein DSM5745_03811 [Aspergillus mulundensis]RDW87169.1 hypothetical protein DSM5745_03811 [Aspergillus mulundensis]
MFPVSTPEGSSPTEVVTQAEIFNTYEYFRIHVRSGIEETHSFRELVYLDVSEDWAGEVTRYVDSNHKLKVDCRINYNSMTKTFWVRVKPEAIHGCQVDWMRRQFTAWSTSGVLSSSEDWFLNPEIGTGTTMRDFQAPYTSSIKEPDYMLRCRDTRQPQLVIEASWAESWSRLLDDKHLWLAGGNGEVGAVLLLQWLKVGSLGKRVCGLVELYGVDEHGNIVMKQRESIFPVPPSEETAPVIPISRHMLFGTRSPGQAPTLSLDISRLREAATKALGLMGLLPA